MKTSLDKSLSLCFSPVRDNAPSLYPSILPSITPASSPTQQPEWAFRMPAACRPTHSLLHAWLPTSSAASLSILPIFHGEFTTPSFFQFLQLTLLPLPP